MRCPWNLNQMTNRKKHMHIPKEFNDRYSLLQGVGLCPPQSEDWKQRCRNNTLHVLFRYQQTTCWNGLCSSRRNKTNGSRQNQGARGTGFNMLQRFMKQPKTAQLRFHTTQSWRSSITGIPHTHCGRLQPWVGPDRCAPRRAQRGP